MMTPGYHALPHPKAHRVESRGAHTIWIAFIAVLGAATAAVLLWSLVSARAQSTNRAREIAQVRAAIVIGMSRADTYRLLRDHGLTARNPAFAAWQKNGLGTWFRSDDGAWPQAGERRPLAAGARPLNPVNPEVEIKLSSVPDGACGNVTIEQLLFDRYDRIKNIAAGPTYWSCQ